VDVKTRLSLTTARDEFLEVTEVSDPDQWQPQVFVQRRAVAAANSDTAE
jgi:hypothetical protein